MADSVSFADGALVFKMGKKHVRVPADTVTGLLECRMADPVQHGDEEFHIVRFDSRFALIGPFVEGGLGAIGRLRAARPDLALTRGWIACLPWSFRESGRFGLRLFPIAGLVVRGQDELARLGLTIGEDEGDG